MYKKQVQKSFEGAVSVYDQNAVLQREMGELLLNWIEQSGTSPEMVLDLGCGTGLASKGMMEIYPQARILSVDLAFEMLKKTRQTGASSLQQCLQADAEYLPLKPRTLDLIFTSATLNWCEDLGSLLKNLFQLLRPQGRLFITLFAKTTLKEIRSAWQYADSGSDHHLLVFPDELIIANFLHEAGFTILRSELKTFQQNYVNSKEAVRSIRRIGAKNMDPKRAKHLTGKQRFQNFLDRLQEQETDQGVPLSYQVFFGDCLRNF